MNTNRATTNGVNHDINLSGQEITMTDRTRPLWDDLPHGEAISALLDALRTLTDDEARDMYDAWDTAWEATFGAAWDAARYAAQDAAWGAVWGSKWSAVGEAACYAASDATWVARDAARDAALALVVADLVGQHGLTREHLGILTAPARVVPRLAEIIDRALGASPLAHRRTSTPRSTLTG